MFSSVYLFKLLEFSHERSFNYHLENLLHVDNYRSNISSSILFLDNEVPPSIHLIQEYEVSIYTTPFQKF